MKTTTQSFNAIERKIMIPSRGTSLSGLLAIPANAGHIVLFAHATENCCHSFANHYLAHQLYQQGVATLLVDLVSPEEQCLGGRAEVHYDLMTLAMRLMDVTDWVHTALSLPQLKISYIGVAAGAAIAILAAIERPDLVHSLILPRSNLSSFQLALRYVAAPTLLINAESDFMHISAAQRALPHLPPGSESMVVSCAMALLDRQSLAVVSEMVGDWLDAK